MLSESLKLLAVCLVYSLSSAVEHHSYEVLVDGSNPSVNTMKDNKKLSDLGDCELQEELLASGFTQYVANLFEKLSPSIPTNHPLESYRFIILNFKSNTINEIQ